MDAILVAASGPEVPDGMKRQLKACGRLVMPVGARDGGQHLVRLTRTGPDGFMEDDLGPVAFVPLIGRQGWSETTGTPRFKVRSSYARFSRPEDRLGRRTVRQP